MHDRRHPLTSCRRWPVVGRAGSSHRGDQATLPAFWPPDDAQRHRAGPVAVVAEEFHTHSLYHHAKAEMACAPSTCIRARPRARPPVTAVHSFRGDTLVPEPRERGHFPRPQSSDPRSAVETGERSRSLLTSVARGCQVVASVDRVDVALGGVGVQPEHRGEVHRVAGAGGGGLFQDAVLPEAGQGRVAEGDPLADPPGADRAVAERAQLREQQVPVGRERPAPGAVGQVAGERVGFYAACS